MSSADYVRLSLDNLPRRGEMLTLPTAPSDFAMRVVWPYNDIGQVKLNVYGADGYWTYVELIRAGASYKNRWGIEAVVEGEEGEALTEGFTVSMVSAKGSR